MVAIRSCFGLIRHHQHDIATNTEACVRQTIKGYLLPMRDAVSYCRDHMMESGNLIRFVVGKAEVQKLGKTHLRSV